MKWRFKESERGKFRKREEQNHVRKSRRRSKLVRESKSEKMRGVLRGKERNLARELNDAFYAVVQTHKRWSNKIYNSKLTMKKI